MEKVLDRIAHKYFQGIANDISNAKQISTIFPNNTDVGDTRENVLIGFLKKHLSLSCSITKGGIVFDSLNNYSKQIDILISAQNNIQFSYFDAHMHNKTIQMIEGCLAAISVKSTLNSSELVDVLGNLASIPQMPPNIIEKINPLLINNTEYSTFPKKIVFAYSGQKCETTLKQINAYYQENPSLSEYQKADLIVVNNSYCIKKIGKGGEKNRRGEDIPEGTYHLCNTSGMNSPGTYPLLQLILTIHQACQFLPHIIFDFQPYINAMEF